MNKLLADRVQNVIARISSATERALFRPKMVDILGQTHLASLDVRRFAQLRAAWDAADIYNRHLYQAEFFPDYLDHVQCMAERAAAFGDGLFLEFGVASGATIRAIATTGRPIVGFNSFAGLPEDWREGARAGAFASKISEVPPNVSLKIGMIEDTLPEFLAANLQPIQFIHIDTDLYGPAKFILDTCRPRMKQTIVVFDEFFELSRIP